MVQQFGAFWCCFRRTRLWTSQSLKFQQRFFFEVHSSWSIAWFHCWICPEGAPLRFISSLFYPNRKLWYYIRTSHFWQLCSRVSDLSGAKWRRWRKGLFAWEYVSCARGQQLFWAPCRDWDCKGKGFEGKVKLLFFFYDAGRFLRVDFGFKFNIILAGLILD